MANQNPDAISVQKPRAVDFFTSHTERTQAYAMADVPDEHYDTIGLVIRKGQEAGEILMPGQTARRPGDAGANATRVPDVFANQTERRDIYAVADQATDEQFDAAITEAKAVSVLVSAASSDLRSGEESRPCPATPQPPNLCECTDVQRRACSRLVDVAPS